LYPLGDFVQEVSHTEDAGPDQECGDSAPLARSLRLALVHATGWLDAA
jgi:hypothetical protein